MKSQSYTGFTIIETMLFLGITCLLGVAVMVGTGTSINAQRYRDSVASLQSVIQQQYSDVMNVSNDGGASVCKSIDGSDELRGQSDCVVVGKYITSTKNGYGLLIRNVIGKIPYKTMASNDVDSFKEYQINVIKFGSLTYDLEWGASLVDQKNSPSVFSILIVRSPVSGAIRTFINNNSVVADSKVIGKELVDNPSSLTESLKTCVDSNGLFMSGKSAIFITPNAAGPSGVENQGDATSGC